MVCGLIGQHDRASRPVREIRFTAVNHMGIKYDEAPSRYFRKPLRVFIEARGVGKKWPQARAVVQSGKEALSMAARNQPKTAILPVGVIERNHHVRQLVAMFTDVAPVG